MSKSDLANSETSTMAAAAIPFEPNVKLAAGAQPLGEGFVNSGMTSFGPIPNAQAQREGFYLRDAKLLVENFSDRFKLIVEKGK